MRQGHLSVGYTDAYYLQGNTIKTCQYNIQATVHLCSYLGFLVQPQKSVLFPTQKIISSWVSSSILNLGWQRLLPRNTIGSKATVSKRNTIIRELTEVIANLWLPFRGVFMDFCIIVNKKVTR